MSRRAAVLSCLMVTALTIPMLPAWAQVNFDFMPDGGRGLLARLLGDDQSALAAMATQQHDVTGWEQALAGHGDLSDRERQTLAGYLSVNFPLPEAAGTDPLAALPQDGRDLAVANCQTCHSIFSGYLMQDRDIQGWRSVFLSPFHRELAMTEKERETFVLYSAANMPIEVEAVPPELRF